MFQSDYKSHCCIQVGNDYNYLQQPPTQEPMYRGNKSAVEIKRVSPSKASEREDNNQNP